MSFLVFFVCLLFVSFLKRCRKDMESYGWGGEEDMGGVGGRENITRIYEKFLSKKINKEIWGGLSDAKGVTNHPACVQDRCCPCWY